MRPRLNESLLFLIPCAVLFLLTRINYTVWPLVWPDEALFSSPAASLARDGVFASPVLEGLIPGMDRATLWNSPLFMVLLAGIYSFTGESLHVARFFSFLLGCGALVVFLRVTRIFIAHRLLALLVTTVLALDPNFQRAANTARMDILTLLFFLTALFFLVRARLLADQGPAAGVQRRSRQKFAYAGLAIGLAAVSHPVAIVLLPVALVFALPGWRNGGWIAVGMVLPLAAWSVYIIPNFDLFEVQFLAQLTRKQSMLSSWEETGGPLVVFAAQFGGPKPVMAAALLIVALVLITGAVRALRAVVGQVEGLFARVFFSFAIVLALVMLLSEAWYPVYVTPLLLLVVAIPAAEVGSGKGRRIALGVVSAFFFGATIVLIARHHFLLRTPQAVRSFETRAVELASGCRTVYVRVRPDPYFLYRNLYPEMEVLEFVPGKLQFRGDGLALKRRYDTIDCFLLDPNDSWEPFLTRYLRGRGNRFSTEGIERFGSLESATLYRRR